MDLELKGKVAIVTGASQSIGRAAALCLAAKAGVALEQYCANLAKDIPLGRVGRAEEVANAIAFLASGAASFITGSSINLDGGTSAVL